MYFVYIKIEHIIYCIHFNTIIVLFSLNMKLTKKLEKINKARDAEDFDNIKTNDATLIKKLYHLYFYGKNDDSIENKLYYGEYYDIIDDKKNMMKYYNICIKNGDTNAMYNLATYYNNIGDYGNMIKYNKMGAKKGCIDSMFDLANYYEDQKNYKKMVKYYKTAVHNGDDVALPELIDHYKNEDDDDNLIKYYLIAMDKIEDYDTQLFDIVNHFRNHKRYESLIKYYLLILEKGDDSVLFNIGSCYNSLDDTDNTIKYYEMAMKKDSCTNLDEIGLYYYNDLGETNEALYCWLKAFEYNPNSLINSDMLFIWYAENNPTTYKMLCKLNKNSGELMQFVTCQLAEWYKKDGDEENMLKYYKKAYDMGIKEALGELINFYMDDDGKLLEMYYSLDNNDRKVMEEYFLKKYSVLFI